MAINDLKAYLYDESPALIPSAKALAIRFNSSTTSVTNTLKRGGYIQTDEGWELPTKQRPVVQTVTTEALLGLANNLVPFSISTTFFNKVMEGTKTHEQYAESLLTLYNLPEEEIFTALALCIAYYLKRHEGKYHYTGASYGN